MAQKIIFAGGGTAGHIEPALAVAREWVSQHPESQILFLGTSAGLENTLVPKAGFDLKLITKVSIPRTVKPSLLKVPFALIRSVSQTVKVVRTADLVVGFGGYVSASAYCAAILTRTPFVIHEANAKPGWANKVGALFTPYIAATYPVSSGRLSNALMTGLPLKGAIAQAYREASSDWSAHRAQAKRELGFDARSPLIFIFGGSQGSVAINKVVEEAAPSLLQKGIQVLHGVGAGNESPEQGSGYMARSYIDDMQRAYLAADLVISRSGAVTCAEVNSLGRYALFIPLPIGNGEQELNASTLVSDGRAEIIHQEDFTAKWLTSNIEALLEKSSHAPIGGSRHDIDAAGKVAALMDSALTGDK